MEIELERTFLVKCIPEGLNKCECREVLDIYIPTNLPHPTLRIRKRGDVFEMTKKQVANGNDSSELIENTIPLSEYEFNDLAEINGKRLHKNRYLYPYENRVAEVDVYLDDLAGLIVVDFEFNSREEMEAFDVPDFCLVEVTQDEVIAGGMLAGKKYADIESDLKKYSYEKIIFLN